MELSGLKLVLASRDYTLIERLNQMSRMMGELESKDHQLGSNEPTARVAGSSDCELKAQLVNVHKGRMQESRGLHANVRLLVDTEKECR